MGQGIFAVAEPFRDESDAPRKPRRSFPLLLHFQTAHGGDIPPLKGTARPHEILECVASDEKPRIFQSGRDMAISMTIIVVLTIAVVLPTGLCTFNPGAPEAGPVHEVDEQAFLSMEAQAVDYPVVVPEVPEGWTPNSARRTSLGDQGAPTTGYVTDETSYLQLIQTDLAPEEAVREMDADPRTVTSTEDIEGTQVEVYTSDEKDVRDAWVFTSAGVTYVISGVAGDTEFAELVRAVLAAEPIAHP